MLTIILSVLRTFHVRRHNEPTTVRTPWVKEQEVWDDPRMEDLVRRIVHSTIQETRKSYEQPTQISVIHARNMDTEASMTRPVSTVETGANWSGASRSLTLEEKSLQTRSHMD